MTRHIACCLSLLVAASSLVGCDSDVRLTDGDNGSGGDSDGGGGEIGNGVGGDTGSAGGGPQCLCGDAAVGVSLLDPGNTEVEGGIELKGAIRLQSPGVWEIDTCLPWAPCSPSIFRLEVNIPGVPIDIPDGTFVSLKSNFDGTEMHNSVIVRNLPALGGNDDNPTSSGEELWFFANAGSVDDGAPLPITRVENCTEPDGDDDFVGPYRAFDLQAEADNGPDGGRITVGANQVQLVSYASGVDAGDYLVSNGSLCEFDDGAFMFYGAARVTTAKP